MKANYHTHTEHCRHASGLPLDYAQEACSKNVEILGISDHAPFKDKDYGFRMPFSELEIYCNEVDQAQTSYKGRLEILKALEIEYLPQYNSYYEELLSRYKMDYLICGQHFFQTENQDFFYSTDLKKSEMVISYANSCKKAMKTGYFKILAHPDLFCINERFPWNDDYEKASDIIIEEAIKTNTILEFNANGYRRGIHNYPDGQRCQYPHKKFWNKVKEADLSALVSSDAHNVDQLWDNTMEEAVNILKNENIKRLEKLSF